MYKEACFSISEYDENGEVVDDVHESLESYLIENFKGFMATANTIIYMDDITDRLVHDEGIVYTVFLEDTKKDLDKLKSLAISFAQKVGQTTVYFKNPKGEVEFLEWDEE